MKRRDRERQARREVKTVSMSPLRLMCMTPDGREGHLYITDELTAHDLTNDARVISFVTLARVGGVDLEELVHASTSTRAARVGWVDPEGRRLEGWHTHALANLLRGAPSPAWPPVIRALHAGIWRAYEDLPLVMAPWPGGKPGEGERDG